MCGKSEESLGHKNERKQYYGERLDSQFLPDEQAVAPVKSPF